MHGEAEQSINRSKRENTLHAAIKTWLAQPGDVIEARLDSWIVDILHDGQVIEVQTGNFSALRPKLESLLPAYPVQVVYPLAVDKWVRRISCDGETLSRRKSPKHAQITEIFNELVYLGRWLTHPRLTLEVLLTREEVIWRDDGRGSWRRRGWSVADRNLLEVTGRVNFDNPGDYASLLPQGLPAQFTNRDLAKTSGLRLALARKMTYTLREMDVLVKTSKKGRIQCFSMRDDGFSQA